MIGRDSQPARAPGRHSVEVTLKGLGVRGWCGARDHGGGSERHLAIRSKAIAGKGIGGFVHISFALVSFAERKQASRSRDRLRLVCKGN